MSDIESFLKDYKEDGVAESEGAFTINFAKAREKLAKFQLPDPHHLILKFVQAGNLAGHEVLIQTKGLLQITISGWRPSLTLEHVADSLTSANLQGGNDPLVHLATGLSTLMGVTGEPILVRQRLQETQQNRLLEIGETLELSEVSEEVAEDSLSITVPFPSQLSASTLKSLLEERCVASTIPILINDQPLKGRLPESEGKHRSHYFQTNRQLAGKLWSEQSDSPVLWQSRTFPSSPVEKGPRTAWVSLSVDFDDKALVWLCQAGVLTQLKHLKLKVPGIMAIVSADDLPTDLTGSQFLDGPAMIDLIDWVGEASRQVRDQALKVARTVSAQGQPAGANAPVRTQDGCLGCLGAMLGCYLTAKALAHWALPYHGVTLAMTNVFFWLAVSFIYPAVTMWRKGAAVDRHSDEKARQLILDTLLASRRRD